MVIGDDSVTCGGNMIEGIFSVFESIFPSQELVQEPY